MKKLPLNKKAKFCIFLFAVIWAVPIYCFATKQEKKITLTDAFRSMAASVQKIIRHEKARPVKEVFVTKDYDVRQYSIITAARLNDVFTGVLKNKGEKFIEVARKNNICPIFFAAVAIHESANGKSLFSREKNNVFGIYLNKKYHTFDSVDACIEYSGKLLGGRLYSGGKNFTIHKIQQIYCPVGAKNDPKSLNKYWLNGVQDKIIKIWGKTVFVTI